MFNDVARDEGVESAVKAARHGIRYRSTGPNEIHVFDPTHIHARVTTVFFDQVGAGCVV